MSQTFYPIPPPVRVPVSAVSAATPFMLDGLLPSAPGLTFIIKNANPFDVRIVSSNAETFSPVTSSTGVLIISRASEGPYTSSRPTWVSAQAFGTPGNPLDPAFDYTNCVVEIVYGTGE